MNNIALVLLLIISTISSSRPLNMYASLIKRTCNHNSLIYHHNTFMCLFEFLTCMMSVIWLVVIMQKP